MSSSNGGDPQVHEAISILRSAIKQMQGAVHALEKGASYNAKGISCNDYFPRGLPDYITRLVEPFVREYVTMTDDQGRDVVGYAALFAGWIKLGYPPSALAATINHLYPEKLKDWGNNGTGNRPTDS